MFHALFHVIVHRLFHLILRYWGDILKPQISLHNRTFYSIFNVSIKRKNSCPKPYIVQT